MASELDKIRLPVTAPTLAHVGLAMIRVVGPIVKHGLIRIFLNLIGCRVRTKALQEMLFAIGGEVLAWKTQYLTNHANTGESTPLAVGSVHMIQERYVLRRLG